MISVSDRVYLLLKASVLICHGGAGTTFRSLWAGVPVVICI